MTIEVRQMLIKSTVLPEGATEPRAGGGKPGTAEIKEEIKEEILADCKQLILEILRGEAER